MALSPATGLANYSSGISSSVLTVDSNSDRVGIGTTNPQDTLQVGTAVTMGSGTVTATQGNFQNVSIAGTLTYEDTTSVDSVGIITARSGISITGGGLSVVGDTDLVGNLTGVNATGISTINNASGTTLNVTGVTTLGNTVVGGATTQLVVNGNTRITGILTMGTSSITLDGTQDKIISGKYDFLGISTSHTDTAVDVFVYDTTKDSDGGEWRKKTSHTSWYNDTLNSATRGSRREFPAVAVIVAEAATVTIYDGDDPDLPLWISFPTTNAKAVTALNGELCLSCNDTSPAYHALLRINFIADRAYNHRNTTNATIQGFFLKTLSSTDLQLIDNGSAYFSGYTSEVPNIISSNTNDVAMTLLPNAPVDDATGLPIPTIAVATANGVSVIKDDGNVVNSSATNEVRTVTFDKNNTLITTLINYDNVRISTSYLYSGFTEPHEYWYGNTNIPSTPLAAAHNGTYSGINAENTYGNVLGLTKYTYDEGIDRLCYITSSYNTGWMHGDIKGAFLSSNVGTAITFTNLSTNGDFGQSSDVASWTAYNATLTHQTDAVRVADNGDYSKAYQSFTTVSGKRYLVTVNCKALSGSDAVLGVRADNPGADSWAPVATRLQESTTGLKDIVFTASGTTSYIELGSTGTGYAEYNNVRIDEVKAEDRIVNGNPLELYGTINRSAVSTGADLDAYSGFSDANLLKNTISRNFGTGDSVSLCVIGWFKITDLSGYNYIGSVADSDNNATRLAGLAVNAAADANAGKLYLYDPITTQTSASGAVLVSDGEWHCAVGVFDGAMRKIYQDGELVHSVGYSSYNLDLTSINYLAAGHVYLSNQTQHHFGGSLSLVRFSSTIPSDEQIKKMYEDEKFLFQENAQATLYGSSDAVTALAYDEITDQIHVGTSSGRSDFQGLRRINNTTTAVTTAISAHDSFIVEQ